MSEKIISNLENIPTPPKSPEEDLSPEVLEKVMAKVQDINEIGTGFHSLTRLGKEIHKLKEVLSDGLLGTPAAERAELNKEKWAKNARSRKGAFVFFNILGKDIDSVEDSFWLKQKNPIGVIFDVKPFKEKKSGAFFSTLELERNERNNYKNRTYGTHGGIQIKGRLSDRERIPYKDDGYALAFRVAPKYFQGIVFRSDRDKTEEEITNELALEQKNHSANFWEEYHAAIEESIRESPGGETVSSEINKQRANEIVNVMQYANLEKANRLIPVYDIHGNLWWPQKMSYEEVKKFVAERDKNKKEIIK